MSLLNITDEYKSFITFTDNGNKDINIPANTDTNCNRFRNVHNHQTLSNYQING